MTTMRDAISVSGSRVDGCEERRCAHPDGLRETSGGGGYWSVEQPSNRGSHLRIIERGPLRRECDGHRRNDDDRGRIR